MSTPILHFSEEVRHAIDAGAPVVALESTIIAHGMPYPRNVETARAVEKIIRDAGAAQRRIPPPTGCKRALPSPLPYGCGLQQSRLYYHLKSLRYR